MTSSSFNTPVVLFIFNRPDLTRQVLEVISGVKPDTLLVIADGPRADVEGDLALVAEARAIIENIDWPCRVLQNYSSVNLGVYERVNGGLNWAFERVTEAIILEDDCLPHPSFFYFCQELLEYYRDDERFFSIRGTEHLTKELPTAYSYYFSKHFNPSGWATWKRAWEDHDPEMKWYQEISDIREFESVWMDSDGEAGFFSQILESQFRGLGPKHWDYRFQFTIWSQNRLVIAPQVNLVKNIGFGPDATHVKNANDARANLNTHAMGPLRHPPVVVRNLEADTFKFRIDQQLGSDLSSRNTELTYTEELEYRLIELGTQIEAKEAVIQQQHRDLMRLQKGES